MTWAALFAVVWIASVAGLLVFCRAASVEPPSPPVDRGLRVPESPAPFDCRAEPGMAGAYPEPLAPIDLSGTPFDGCDPVAWAETIVKETRP